MSDHDLTSRKINDIRAIHRDVGPLTRIGTVVHAGAKTGIAEGRIIDSNGKLYAHGTVTCILFRDLTTGEQP